MREDRLTITTIEKSIDSIIQLVDYIDELGHISIHMAKQTKDEWIGGYNGIWMNE
jgi:hypothetical protein